MEKEGLAVVLVTASGREEADKIAAALLEKRQAACVNVVPGVSSRYWWQGKLDSSEEVLLVIKTRQSLVDALITTVKENHSYTVPEVIALPIIGGSRDYLDWVETETS
jgi:periplasmic divalent cation tolerance protein